MDNVKDEMLERSVELFTPDRTGKGYICPICGSGSGSKGTGITTKDGKHFTCWAGCFTNADIFEILGQQYGLQDFPEQKHKAMQLLNISDSGDYKKMDTEKKLSVYTSGHTQVDKHTQTADVDFTEYYKKCASQISQTDYLAYRGISEETAKRFNLGYDKEFRVTDGGSWEALIIPTSKTTFTARNTDRKSEDRYRNKGSANLFNTEALEQKEKPVFIVEGEIDALSIAEAGGEAVALGSTSNVTKLIRLLSEVKPAHHLILNLDNDDAGEKAKAKLVSSLEALGIQYVIASPNGEYKDANEALTADRDLFLQAVREAEAVETPERTAKRKLYQKNCAKANIQGFLNEVLESAANEPIPTGFTELDRVLDGGLNNRELYILGAISSAGKTTLALQVTDNIAKAGKDVLIISLEMARNELIGRSISRETIEYVLRNGGDTENAKTYRGITRGSQYAYYSTEEKQLIDNAINSYDSYAAHIYILEDDGNTTAKDIREAVQDHIAFTGNTPVVVIDYLQNLAVLDKKYDMKQNMDYSVKELRQIARDFETPVIAISTMNRASYGKESEQESFKESGQIEYSADVLLGLQFEKVGKDGYDVTAEKNEAVRKMILKVLKNRNGRTGDRIKYDYWAMFNYFEEVGIEERKR